MVFVFSSKGQSIKIHGIIVNDCLSTEAEAPRRCSYCYGNQEWFYCNLASQSKCLQLKNRLPAAITVNLSRRPHTHKEKL